MVILDELRKLYVFNKIVSNCLLLNPGGMKPNTLVMGFYDNSYPDDYFLQDPVFCQGADGCATNENDEFGVDLPSLQAHFGPVRDEVTPRSLAPDEYVGIISDAIKMNKNVCLGRYFHQLQPSEGRGLRGDGAGRTIDVWPLNLLRPSTGGGYADVCSLFLLQMACVLNMAGGWRRARMRIFLCADARSLTEEDHGWTEKEQSFRELLDKLRIRAKIKVVAWDGVVRLLSPVGDGPRHLEDLDDLSRAPLPVTQEFLSAVNGLLREHSSEAAVRFLYLPRPPAVSAQYQRYLAQLDTLSRNLGPTLLIHGLTPVTCTEL